MDDSMEKLWGPTFTDFAKNQRHFPLEVVQDFLEVFTTHFFRERKAVGLHGLYTKYRDYVPGLAANFSLHGHLYVKLLEVNQVRSQNYTPADERKEIVADYSMLRSALNMS